MKTDLGIYLRLLTAGIFAAGAVWLASESKAGWGWCIFAAIVLGQAAINGKSKNPRTKGPKELGVPDSSEIHRVDAVPEHFDAACDKTDWTPREALEFYAAGKHFDTSNGMTRILDTGAIASNALKHSSLGYLEMKGDAELSELREQLDVMTNDRNSWKSQHQIAADASGHHYRKWRNCEHTLAASQHYAQQLREALIESAKIVNEETDYGEFATLQGEWRDLIAMVGGGETDYLDQLKADYELQIKQLREAFSKYAVLGLPDHACKECVPHSDILVDGFLCEFHRLHTLPTDTTALREYVTNETVI